MPTKTLDINTLTIASPATPPAGYTKPAAASNADVVLTTTREWKMSAGGTQALWYDNTAMTGALRKAEVVTGSTNGTAVGAGIVDDLGNGYFYYSNDGNSNSRLYRLAAYSLGTQIGGNITSTHAAGQTRAITWETGGVIKLWLNGVQIGTTFNDTTTADPKYACMISRGANLRSLTSEYADSRTIESITDPIIFGEPLTIETTGFTGPTSITAAGMTAVIDSFEDGVIAATWPALDEGLVCTIPLPATNVQLTVSESGGSASVNVDFPLPNEYPEFVEFDNINTGGRYIGGKITLEEGWRSYYDNTQLGGMEIHPDSGVTCTDAGTFTMLLHRIGDENDMVKYFITVNEHGDVTNVRGLTVSGVSVKGLSMKGLAIKGL